MRKEIEEKHRVDTVRWGGVCIRATFNFPVVSVDVNRGFRYGYAQEMHRAIECSQECVNGEWIAYV